MKALVFRSGLCVQQTARLGIQLNITYTESSGRFADSTLSLPCATTRLVRYCGAFEDVPNSSVTLVTLSQDFVLELALKNTIPRQIIRLIGERNFAIELTKKAPWPAVLAIRHERTKHKEICLAETEMAAASTAGHSI
ncbi:hypothetical protein J6590_082863 [Homalodisca vitripennis]|nr:hypothetical protein J6590_082863 [Homalodisca vitripennis]